MKLAGVALAVGAAFLFSQQACAINKCTGPDGRIAFQDAPCSNGKSEPLQVKPASGMAPSAPFETASAPRRESEAARLERIVAGSQRDRRSLELRERLLPDAERALAVHRNACAETQAQLRDQQYIYRQNLYGKTHAAQIASEMAAAAALCDTKDRELKDSLDVLTKECANMKCRR